MDWQGALRARLTAAAPVTALVGQKIYWEQAPQGTVRPYLTMLDVTQLLPQHLKGFDLEFARVQVDVWANTYASKQAIMQAVIDALVPSNASNGHIFQRAMVDLGPRDVAGERDGDTPIFRKSADLLIHHSTA